MNRPTYFSSSRSLEATSLRVVLVASALMASAAGSALAQTAPADDQPAASDPVSEVIVTDKAMTEPEGSEASGYRNRTGQVGPLGKMTLKDTPFSLNVTSGELIENSNAHTAADALKTNPTATSMMSSGGYPSMSRIMVRGFSASDQNELRDGMSDRSFTWVPMENVERVDVLNGLSSFLSGFGSSSGSGGLVNYVSKKPTDKPLASLNTGVYNGGVGFAHADMGGRVAATGDRVGYRVNLYHEDGSTYIDDSSQQRSLFSAAFDVRLAPDTKLWTDIWYQKLHATGIQTYIAPANWNTQGVPDASKFDPTKQYGQNWTYNKSEKTVAGLGLDTKLSDIFSARLGYRHGTMWRDYALVTDIVQTDGNSYKQYYTRSARQNEVTNAGYAMLDAKFDTLGIHHDATAGYNASKYYFMRGWDVPGSPGTTGQLLGSSSIDSPAAFANPNLSAGGKSRQNPVRWDSFLVGDVIKFNEQWSVLAGVTHARYSSKTADWGVTAATASATEKASRLTQSADTPSYAIMFKPVPSVTTYASYAESLEPGGTAPATFNGHVVSNAYEIMPPNVSKQYEVGVKNTIGGMDLNTALFRIEKANEYTDPSSYIYKQDGHEIHQGVEFTGTGKLTEDLTFVGGFTWMDAHIEEAKAAPTTEGKTPVNVPDWQGRAYLEYALPFLENLTAIGGANYYGRRPVTTTNTKLIHEAATVDLGLRYKPELYGHPMSINLGVTNLFDTSYWAYWYSNGEGMMLGQPRLVSLSVKASW